MHRLPEGQQIRKIRGPAVYHPDQWPLIEVHNANKTK
jgi:hypothetical protein